jgi:hypothetical protein
MVMTTMPIEHPYGQYYPVNGYYNNPYFTSGSTLTNTYTMNPLQLTVQSAPYIPPESPPPVVDEAPLDWLDRRVCEITELLGV